nr:transposase [Castellaniella sp. S9]
MNLTTYSQAFKEEAVRKTLQRSSGRTISDVARQMNVPYHSLRNWLRSVRMAHQQTSASGEKRAADWSPEQRLQALLDTHNLSESELNAWCREHGLFAHQLAEWRAQLIAPAKPGGDATELRRLKDEITTLQRQINRKDKALSEAAALLVLQKKYQALWEDEDK